MSRYKLLFLCIITLGLLSCVSNPPQSRAFVSESEKQQAKKLIRYKDYSNIYISRVPDQVLGTTYKVYVNDKQISDFSGENVFVNVKALPGTYHFIVEESSAQYPDNEFLNGRRAEFDITVEAGSLAMIACGQIGWYEAPASSYLLPEQECTESSRHQVKKNNGITACVKPYLDLGVRVEDDTGKSFKNCLLHSKPEVFFRTAENMIKADIAVIEDKSAREFAKAKKIDTIAAYQEYLSAFPNSKNKPQVLATIQSMQQRQAQQQSDQQAELAIKAIAAKEKCKLKDSDWLYIGNNCSGGYANGQGRAVNINQQNSFKGKISNGHLVSGDYLLDGNVIFEGTFSNGKPNGYGICTYKNKPEECRYHKGFRIDSLYKQREHMVAMEQRRQEDMTQLRKEISSIKSQRSYSAGSTSATGDIVNAAGKVVVDKAADYAVQELFKHLF